MNPENPNTTNDEPNNVPPVEPTSGPAPTNEPPVAPYVASDGNGSNTPKKKKTLLIASIVGGLLLLIGAGIGIFYLMTHVSAEDYSRAETRLTEMRRADTAMVSEVSSLSRSITTATDDTFDEKLTEARGSLDKIKTENEALAKEKAVRFGEGATLYKAFNDKAQTYIVYVDELISSVDKIRPAMEPCQKIGKSSVDVDDRASVVDDCVAELEKVGELPNAEFNRYFGTLKDKYAAYGDLYERYNKLTSPTGSQRAEYIQIRDETNDLLAEIRTLRTDFLSDLDKRDKETSLKDVADKLRDFLKEQRS